MFVFVVSSAFWGIGTTTIPRAAAWPWNWNAAAFIFHASMFALVLASYGIVATALGYRATERVEAHVADVENAQEVSVGSSR